MPGKPIFESWDGPATTDPEVIRKRRFLLLALIALFGALAIVAVWLGGPDVGLKTILIVAALVAIPSFAFEILAKRRARRGRP